MAMGEAEGVAPARHQNLVPLHTYRPIFWILGQNCGGSQTQDLHHWFLSWVKTTNRQSYRHLRKRNALNRQMALHQDLYRCDPITKKHVNYELLLFQKRRLQLKKIRAYIPPVYLHLILEISSVTWFFFNFKLEKKSSLKQTRFFAEFELEIYCLCSLQKSSSNSKKNRVCFKLDFFSSL